MGEASKNERRWKVGRGDTVDDGAMMAKAARKRDGEAKFRRELARRVGRAESTVRKWIRRSDWVFGEEGPWDVKRVKEWMGLNLKM